MPELELDTSDIKNNTSISELTTDVNERLIYDVSEEVCDESVLNNTSPIKIHQPYEVIENEIIDLAKQLPDARLRLVVASINNMLNKDLTKIEKTKRDTCQVVPYNSTSTINELNKISASSGQDGGKIFEKVIAFSIQ